MSTVRVIKLVSGEEIVGQVVSQTLHSSKVTINRPLALQPFPGGSVGFADFMSAAKTETIEIESANIILNLEASDDCAKQYTDIQSEIADATSGIALPEAKNIVL